MPFPSFLCFPGVVNESVRPFTHYPLLGGWGESGRGIVPLVGATLRTHVIGYLLRVNGHDGLLGHTLWILKQR